MPLNYLLDTHGSIALSLKYRETLKDFVKVLAIDTTNKKTDLYFEKKYTTFD